MKSESLPKSNPPSTGFNASAYAKQSTKAGKKFQRTSIITKYPAIQSKDRRSSHEWTSRVKKGNYKPKSITLGGSKGNKGVTIYKKGKV